jgi:two-component system, OmpR family, KDP operon response regulator KdpE
MSKRVLIIEECAIARSVLGILLQRNGWEVIGAADGAEALRVAASWHFDLVITAPEPSKVPGIQLLRLLRGGLLAPQVRVLLQVDHRETIGEVALMALVDDVLVKDEQIERQLNGKLSQWFAPSQATTGAPRKRIAHRKTQCAKSLHPVSRVRPD